MIMLAACNDRSSKNSANLIRFSKICNLCLLSLCDMFPKAEFQYF